MVSPLYLLILALLIYMVVRQFRERQIQFPTILIFPALLTYYTFINVTTELTKSAVHPTWLIFALIVGFIPGICIGLFRGNLARMRMDTTTGNVYAKGTALSLTIWCVLLLVKIGASYLTYTHVGLTVIPLLLLISVLHTLFLGNIFAETFRLSIRSAHFLQPEVHPLNGKDTSSGLVNRRPYRR